MYEGIMAVNFLTLLKDINPQFQESHQTSNKKYKKSKYQDFPGGPVAKTPHSQCSGTGFDPWSGN